MDIVTLVDLGSAFIILLSAILAYARGFVREIFSILGWVLAAIVAFYYPTIFVPLVLEIPTVSGMLSGSCDLTVLASAFFVFILALIVIAILTRIFAGAVQRSALSSIDQWFGFLFGLIRGVAIILVTMNLYWVDNTITGAVLGQFQESVQASTLMDGQPGQQAWSEWAQGLYGELTASCSQ